MAKVRDVLLKLEVRTSLRANKCKRNANHKIPKGNLWLIVTPRGPAARDFGYCVDCGIAMLEAAQANLSSHLSTSAGFCEDSYCDEIVQLYCKCTSDSSRSVKARARPRPDMWPNAAPEPAPNSPALIRSFVILNVLSGDDLGIFGLRGGVLSTGV